MRFTPAVAALLVLGIATPAIADEGESALSVALTYNTFHIPEHSPSGTGLGIDYERGVTDVLWLRASAGGGVYFGDEAFAYSSHGTVGVTYALDVIKYVPYVNLGLGGIVITAENIDTDLHPLVELGGGLDVLVSRNLSWGVRARFESYLDRTAFVSAGARLSWRWGFF